MAGIAEDLFLKLYLVILVSGKLEVRMEQIGAGWYRIVQTSVKLCKLVQVGEGWCRMLQFGANYFSMLHVVSG